MKDPHIYFNLFYKVEYKVIMNIRTSCVHYHESTSFLLSAVCFSKCSPLTSITSITWKLVRYAKFETLARHSGTKSLGMPSNQHLTRFLGDPDAQ